MNTHTETKHTPGPWQAGLDIPFAANNNTDPCLVWSGTKLVIDCRSKWIGRSETEANARLIAAAPDLLEIARQVLWLGANSHNIREDAERFTEYFEQLATKAETVVRKATEGAQ